MKFIFRIYFTIKEISDKINKDNVAAYAAESSFFIIVCFFPFILFLFTIIQYTPITEHMLLEFFITVTPSQIMPFIEAAINEIYSRSSVTLISITAISTLWISGKAFMGITQGLNSIYGVEEKRNYMFRRIVASLYTLLLIVVIVLILMLLVFGNKIFNILSGVFPLLALIVGEILRYKTLIVQCLLTLFFMMLYKFVPSRHGSLVKELPGALFAAIGWQAFSFLYSLYINNSSGFAMMYGSLASIVFTMLWLYFCISIVFYGAEINTFIEHRIINLPMILRIRKSSRRTNKSC